MRRNQFVSEWPQAFIELELAGLMKEVSAPHGSKRGRPQSKSYLKRARAELDEASELELNRLRVSIKFCQRQR